MLKGGLGLGFFVAWALGHAPKGSSFLENSISNSVPDDILWQVAMISINFVDVVGSFLLSIVTIIFEVEKCQMDHL